MDKALADIVRFTLHSRFPIRNFFVLRLSRFSLLSPMPVLLEIQRLPVCLKKKKLKSVERLFAQTITVNRLKS